MIYVNSISVSPAEKSVPVGRSLFFNATVYPLDATSPSVHWYSSNTDVVTINELSGLAIAQSGGRATIKVFLPTHMNNGF